MLVWRRYLRHRQEFNCNTTPSLPKGGKSQRLILAAKSDEQDPPTQALLRHRLDNFPRFRSVYSERGDASAPMGLKLRQTHCLVALLSFPTFWTNPETGVRGTPVRYCTTAKSPSSFRLATSIVTNERPINSTRTALKGTSA